MLSKIVGFGQDQHKDWFAILACGHRQHVRHRPPQVYREWVLTAAGRQQKLGSVLNCIECESQPI